MNLRNARIIGYFDSGEDPRDLKDKISLFPVIFTWEWRESRKDRWRPENLQVSGKERWDGTAGPDIVRGWGNNSAASLAYYKLLKTRKKLSNGEPISRKHTDLLYLHLMCAMSDGWLAPVQLLFIESCYRAGCLFGEPVWDSYDVPVV